MKAIFLLAIIVLSAAYSNGFANRFLSVKQPSSSEEVNESIKLTANDIENLLKRSKDTRDVYDDGEGHGANFKLDQIPSLAPLNFAGHGIPYIASVNFTHIYLYINGSVEYYVPTIPSIVAIHPAKQFIYLRLGPPDTIDQLWILANGSYSNLGSTCTYSDLTYKQQLANLKWARQSRVVYDKYHHERQTLYTGGVSTGSPCQGYSVATIIQREDGLIRMWGFNAFIDIPGLGPFSDMSVMDFTNYAIGDFEPFQLFPLLSSCSDPISLCSVLGNSTCPYPPINPVPVE